MASKDVVPRAVCAPSNRNVAGSWPLLSEVRKPISCARRLETRNPIVAAATGSASNTSSTNAATPSARSRRDRNCMNVTHLPQFAGDRLLPSGCTRIFALYGLLFGRLIEQVAAALLGDSCDAVVLYALEKSTDQARGLVVPTCDNALKCATKTSKSFGRYGTVTLAVASASDRDRSSITLDFRPWRPC